MGFVLDASVTAAWLLADETSALAEAALDRLSHEVASVPVLWRFEIRNLLILAERRGRIDKAQTSHALDNLNALSINLDTVPDSDMVMRLARQHRLTVYDAAYLELAIRAALPLATLDKALIAAAKAEGVRLIEAHR